MTKKVRVGLILIVAVLCFGAYAYGAQSDRARVILATLNFTIGFAEIKPAFENDLKKIKAALEADPAMGLRIEGYGQHLGAPQKDREISQKRARAIQQWFLKEGIEKSRLMIKNTRDSKPAIQKDAAKDPSLSERVVILQVSLKQPLAFLPAARYQFDPVVEGQEVAHDFIVQNKGTAPLEIQKVKTD